jgi:hypothetical protein
MNDYQCFLDENGLEESAVRAMSEDVSSQILLNDYYGVSVRPSEIEGQGLFADENFKAGAAIVPALIKGKKTIGGRFTNHSGTPNAIVRGFSGDKHLVSLKDIAANDELTVDYRESKKLTDAEYCDHKVRMSALTMAIDQAIENGAEEANKEPINHFAHGTYGRELFIKAGTYIVGKVHRFDCITVFLSGRLRIVTDSGDFDVVAPRIMTTGTGNKGIYAYEDSIMFTSHPNPADSRDMAEIENNIVAPSYEALEKGVGV